MHLCRQTALLIQQMIDAFTDKFDAPLRSGNYVAVIPRTESRRREENVQK